LSIINATFVALNELIMINYEENDRTCVVDSAIKHNLGTQEEIRLYKELSLALELIPCDEFNVVNSCIENGIHFGITTRFPHELPVEVGWMFFNVDLNFDVRIKETSQCVYNMERYFQVNLKKY